MPNSFLTSVCVTVLKQYSKVDNPCKQSILVLHYFYCSTMFPDVQPQFFLLQFMLLRRVHSLSLRLFLFDSCGHVFSAEMAAGFHALINQTLQNRIDGPSYLNCPLQAQLRNLLSLYHHPSLCIWHS